MTRCYPLKSGTYTLSSGFGMRWGALHAGQDFAAPDGTPIYACQGGTVKYIGSASGYGQWIVIDHDDSDGGGVTEYGHMWDAFATGLRVGDRVEAGQLIAYVGSNGESTGPHLHLSVMPREYNPSAKIDPLPWLSGASEPGQETNTMADIFWADVSEFQVPVNDAYPYDVLAIRSNDGTYRDDNFTQNYAWMRAALDSGRLKVGIVYAYLRPNWAETADTMIDMINRNGGLHPKVALMLDVESGGNPRGEGSDWINRTYWRLADFTGDRKRVFAYANRGDFDSMWSVRPDGLLVIGAGYGSNPQLPGQIGHQYTDGLVGAGQGLPMGCAPFGNCDMNTSPMSSDELAAALGVGAPPAPPVNQIDLVASDQANNWLGDRITRGENVTPDGVGRFAQFAAGYVYWHPDHGAYAIPNALFEAYAEYGWEAGELGYPVAAYTHTPAGDIQAFEGGVLYRKSGAPHGFYVHGSIGERWASLGWENSQFGWPTANETDHDGGRMQTFERGTLYWNPTGVIGLTK